MTTNQIERPKARAVHNPSGVDVILARLREKGGRVTAARRTTIEVLLATRNHHVSTEQIVEIVRSRCPEVADSTVYRTLATLEDLGVISHVHLGHGPATFHLIENCHRHLVCRRCNATVEIPTGAFDALAHRIDQDYGFSLTREHFAISGECKTCRA